MKIIRNGSQALSKGVSEDFTGIVRIDSRFKGNDNYSISRATVTFDPSSRTAWHTHPLGQTLIVLFGRGLVQREGGKIEAINPGI